MSEKATEVFVRLKQILTTAPVLVYPNFKLQWKWTLACDIRVGEILLQEEHLVAFYSKKLSMLRQRESTYVKEL